MVYEKALEKIKEEFSFDLSKSIFIGLGQANAIIEIAHGEESDAFVNEAELLTAMTNKFVDIDWGALEKDDTIPYDVCVALIRMFSEIDYFIFDSYDADTMLITNDAVIGELPSGLTYEMKNYIDNIDKICCYKLCNFKGSLLVLYSENANTKDLMEEIDCVEDY